MLNQNVKNHVLDVFSRMVTHYGYHLLDLFSPSSSNGPVPFLHRQKVLGNTVRVGATSPHLLDSTFFFFLAFSFPFFGWEGVHTSPSGDTHSCSRGEKNPKQKSSLVNADNEVFFIYLLLLLFFIVIEVEWWRRASNDLYARNRR